MSGLKYWLVYRKVVVGKLGRSRRRWKYLKM